MPYAIESRLRAREEAKRPTLSPIALWPSGPGGSKIAEAVNIESGSACGRVGSSLGARSLWLTLMQEAHLKGGLNCLAQDKQHRQFL